ncbi:gelsolin-like protein 1 [Diaphorina citri]|uniref:Gelsolin-like protein 1 n=1 Tax=Diaphorina citri TaxID=121845 RepID=A0A3Q0IQS5_DIACI|nr:gelsolin-like protein 1 [Diaphorina citri]
MSETSTAGVDPAFANINTSFTTFLIWRVEKLELVAVPPEQYGRFYEGDSYLVFAASEPGKNIGPSSKVSFSPEVLGSNPGRGENYC